MSEYEMNEQTPAFEEPVIVKPKSKKGLWIGIAAALVVIAVAVAVVLGMVSSSPLTLLATGFRNSVEAMQEDAFTKLMEQANNSGSVEISMDISSALEQSGLPMSCTVSAKAYMNQQEQRSAMTLGVQLAGQTLDASIFANQESVAFASQILLGDKAYGFGLKDFVENFNKSVFGPDGAYALDIELPEELQSQLDGYQTYAEDMRKLAPKLGERLIKILEENSTVEKEDSTLTLGGEEVKTTAVIIKMDHNQLATALEQVLNYLRTDEEIKAFVQEHKAIIFGDDAENFGEEFYKWLDEAAAEDMDELRKEIEEEEAGVEVAFHITKSGKQLIGMELFLASNEEPGELNIYAGPDLKNTKELRVEIGNGDETVKGTYLVKMDDDNTFVALLDLCENEEALMKADIRWDKQTGAWEIIGTNSQNSSVGIRGTLEITDKELSATLESIEIEGQKTELGMGMVVRAQDTMPEMPQYKDLLAMTEDEVANLVNELSMIVFQLMYGMTV